MARAKKLSFYSIFFIASVALQAQSGTDSKGTIEARIYTGGSFLIDTPPEYTEDYFRSLRQGLNLGSEVIYFLKKFGFGLNFDRTNSSAAGLTASRGVTLDQELKVSFLGPLIATRTEINRYSAVTFYFSYGRQAIEDLATIDGISSTYNKKRNVSKVSLRYEYKVSEVMVGIGVHYFNGNPPRQFHYFTSSGIGPFGRTTTTIYNSGVGLKRVGLNVSCSYRF